MKKFSTKRSIHKLIALWLVCLMMLAPLLSYAGGSGSAKADGGDSTAPSFQVSISVEPTWLEKDGDILVTSYDGDYESLDVGNDNIFFNVEYEAEYLHVADNNVSGCTITLTDGGIVTETENKKYNGASYSWENEYRYVVITAGESYNEKGYVQDIYQCTSSLSEISLGLNQTLLIYVRPSLPPDWFNTEGGEGDRVGYCLVKSYTVDTQEGWYYGGNPCWLDEKGVSVNSGTAVKCAKLNAEKLSVSNGVWYYDQNSYLGSTKYCYIDSAAYEGFGDSAGEKAYLSSYNGWSETVPELGTAMTSGTYYGYYGYFDSNNRLVSYQRAELLLDTTPPGVPTNLTISYASDGASFTELPEGKTYFADVNAPGCFSLSFVPDAQDVNDSKFQIYKKDGDAEWQTFDVETDITANLCGKYFYASDLSESGTKFGIRLMDKAGNKTEIIEFSPMLKLIDKSLTIDKIVLVDEYKSPVSINTLKNNETAYINKQYYLKVTASSGYTLSSMAVLDSSDKECSGITSFEGNTQNDEGRYEAVGYIPIPKELDTNQILNEIYVKVGDGNNSVVSSQDSAELDRGALITYFYDQTKPEIAFFTLANGSEVEVDSRWHQSYMLGYDITQGAMSESALKSASYSVDGGAAVSLLKSGTTVTGLKSAGADMLDVPESKTVQGTSFYFDAADLSGNELKKDNNQNVVAVLVDKTAPDVTAPNINGKQYNQIALTTKQDIVVQSKLSDNLTLDTVTFKVIYPNNTIKEKTISVNADAAGANGIEKSVSYTLTQITGDTVFADGQYQVYVTAADKSGRVSQTKISQFEIDNTPPVTDVRISAGTDGGKAPRNWYFNSDVTLTLTCQEKNIDIENDIIVQDNGNTVYPQWKKSDTGYIASYTAASEGMHSVTIQAFDRSGTSAEAKSATFVIDKTAPSVTAVINGGIVYSENMGYIDLQGDANVSVSVTDMTEDIGDLNFRVTQTKPGQETTTSEYIKTENRSFSFNEEADYTLNLFAVDMANNQGDTRNVSFRVDKTAPDISITGISAGGTSANAATVTFTMRESFWWDATGTVTIYRKAGDGSEEALLKTVDFKPTGYETSMSETLSDTGVYRIEFAASDRVGHKVNTSQTFTIDREAPVITLQGVRNYDVTDQTVEFTAEVADDFYSSKEVTIKGTRTDAAGKVNQIQFSFFNQHGNPTVISESFAEDGIYDIEVASADAAGNRHTSTVHFTVDKTKPVIGDLSAYDGTILRAFKWDKDLDELVTDLTVCEIHMYLNGSEYDGESEIEDGSYTLLITAEDELGHYAEKSLEFVLDTKAPVFIVTGVEDGEVKNDVYSIDVSLQLEEDMLTSVTLNGKEISITDNTAHLEVSEKGDYALTMKAKDTAGNEAEQTIEFKFGEEQSGWIWIIVAACVLLLAGMIILLVAKKRKNKGER